MYGENNLKRFLDAQQADYETALAEIKNGRKQSHWMWYIFPQMQGLGSTETSKFFAIKSIEEAQEFLEHPVLGSRLLEISNALLNLKENNATAIFGSPDDMKLRSSMTLFAEADHAEQVFQKVLDKFFNGKRDNKTLQIINNR
jgi:uncharacterized protein (DUF1810 family)